MRDVDEIMQKIREHPRIPPVHKQVMLARLDPPPTQEELDAARRIVYPGEGA